MFNPLNTKSMEGDGPSVAPEGLGDELRDEFGPPHAHQVSNTLQLWILIPGLIALLVVGELRAHNS